MGLNCLVDASTICWNFPILYWSDMPQSCEQTRALCPDVEFRAVNGKRDLEK